MTLSEKCRKVVKCVSVGGWKVQRLGSVRRSLRSQKSVVVSVLKQSICLCSNSERTENSGVGAVPGKTRCVCVWGGGGPPLVSPARQDTPDTAGRCEPIGPTSVREERVPGEKEIFS
jgi:hypothetical protein